MLTGKAAEAANRASTPGLGAGPPALLGVGVGPTWLLTLVHSGNGSKKVSLTAAKVMLTAAKVSPTVAKVQVTAVTGGVHSSVTLGG